MAQLTPDGHREQRTQMKQHAGWDESTGQALLSLFRSNTYGIRWDQETQLRRGGQSSDLGRIAIEKLQAFEAGRIELVIDVFGEVGVYVGLFETQAWSPFAGDVVETCGLEAVVAGLLEHCR